MPQETTTTAQESRYTATTRSEQKTLSLSDFSKHVQKYEIHVSSLYLSVRILHVKYIFQSDFKKLSQDLRFFLKRLESFNSKPSVTRMLSRLPI